MAKPTAGMSVPKANLCGLFAGDWATDDKVSLLAETFTIFSSLQKIAEEQRLQQRQAALQRQGSGAPYYALVPPVQTLQYYHRIANLYREALKRYISKLEVSDQEQDTSDLDISLTLHTVLHFVETLYIPTDGRGTGVLGEEILHWLNSFDFAPRTEDGQAIAQNAVPYEHASFWDYVLRCVLRGFHSSAASLLSSLATTHPSPTLRRIGQRVCELLSSMPRSTVFNLEHDFLAAHRRWVGSVRSLLNKLEQDMDEMELELEREHEGRKSHDDIEDERLEFEAQFRCLLELMIGVKERVFEACDDWREALGAWGVLVQPSLKRDDVPQIMQTILDTFPIDATLPSDVVLCALAQGDVQQACSSARKLDPWLAAHMTDLLDRTGVLEDEKDEDDMRLEGKEKSEQDNAIRITLIQEYAETVLDDQGLWRLAVDYLSYCGKTARRRMRNIVLDVPMNVAAQPAPLSGAKRAEELQADALDAEMDEQADDPDEAREQRRIRKDEEREAKRVSDEYQAAMEVIQTCVELGMHDEARAICKKMSVEMVKQKRMGPALAYCVRARDVRQIKRIIQAIVQRYIVDGVEEFNKAVDSIPISLLNSAANFDDEQEPDDAKMDLQLRQGSSDERSALAVIAGQKSASGNLTDRLVFLARYRDFHRLYAQGDLRAAATTLVEILTSNSAPESFRAVLLVDAIPLLQSEENILTTQESYDLLRILDGILSASLSHPRQAHFYLSMLERLLSPNAAQLEKGTKRDAENDGVYVVPQDEERARADDERWESGDHAFDAQTAVRRLDILRLALVRHLAHSAVHA